MTARAMRLVAHELAIGYPGVEVGSGISLQAGPGAVLCLLGPNGSGKTTLLKTVLGLLAPRAGEVRLDGALLATLSRRDIARRAAYVPQAHAAPFAFDVEQVVMMGRTALLGTFAQPGAADRTAATRALERLGIGELAALDYTRLSGGQRQLVLIARALAQDAALLVMDEPTASLDFGNQARVLSVISDLAAGGLTVLFTTHDPDHAFAVGTDVVLLDDGRVVASGAPREVLTPGTLSGVYGIEVSVERIADNRTVCVPSLARQSGPVTGDEGAVGQ